MPRPPITTFSSVAVKEVSTNKNNGLYAPQLTTAQRDAIPIANLEKRGGIIYNTTDNVFQFFQDGNWIDLNSSGGNVVGPNNSIPGDIAVYADTTGKIIVDSGVAITQVPVPIVEALFALTEENNSTPSLFSNDVINEIGNLGHIKFVNDLGIIFVDGLMPVEFITNNIGDEEQVCSLFTGGLPSSSSSPSALLELQTSTGALLFSRLTQTEINALILPVVGMVVYNTTTNKLNVYTSTGWLPLLTNADIPSTTVTLTGGVTGSGTTGTPITTTVVSVAPSAINGYPNTTSTFLRGDGAWTNVLSGSLGLGGMTPTNTAELQFPNSLAPRKIVISEITSTNNFQFTGIGFPGDLSFNLQDTSKDFVFNAALGPSSANTLMRIRGNGNVGIGLNFPNFPNAPLQFSNTLANRKIVLLETGNNDHQVVGLGTASDIFRFQVNSTSSDYVFNAGNSSTGSNELLRIKGNGNVGIGTNAPNAPLQFSSDFQSRKIVFYEQANNDNQVVSLGTEFEALEGGIIKLKFQTFIGGAYTFNSFNGFVTNELVRIKGTGNVGIGTSTPNVPLQFSNTLANRKIVLLETGNNDHQVVGLGTASDIFRFQVDSTSSDYVFNAGVSSSLSTELVRITGGGKVGIGTSTPHVPLQFANILGGHQIIFFEIANNGNQVIGLGTLNDQFTFQVHNTSTDYVFNAGTSSTTSNELVRITGTGNVGIGTTSPNVPLQFSNTLANRKIVLLETENNDHQVVGLGTASNIFRFQVDSTSGNYVFNAGTSSTTSNELVRITGSGNVGIGVSNPAFKLDVADTINTTNIRCSNFLTSTDLENNYIVLGGVNVSGNPGNRYIRYRSGSSPFSFAGSIYSNFDSQHYFIVADSSGWKFNVLNSGTTTPSFTGSTTAICITTSAMVGIGTTTANAPLQFSNTLANRKIVLFQTANNDHQVMGLGTASNVFRFQVDSTSSDYVFNAGTSSTTSNEVARIQGNGNMNVAGTFKTQSLSIPFIQLGRTTNLTTQGDVIFTTSTQNPDFSSFFSLNSAFIVFGSTGYYRITCCATFSLSASDSERQVFIEFKNGGTTLLSASDNIVAADSGAGFGGCTINGIVEITSTANNVYKFNWGSFSQGNAALTKDVIATIDKLR